MTALKVTQDRPDERSSPGAIPDVILATANFQAIKAACRLATTHRRLTAICGEAGLGKTVALQIFQKANKNVFMMTVRPSMGIKTFWVELMSKVCLYGDKVLSTSYYKRPLYFTLNKICQAFNQYENPLLIIDEAGKLTPQMLLHLHEVRDETKSNLGIVISGPNYFKDNLEYWASRNKQGIPELITRINSWVHLEVPTIYEMKAICKEYQVTDPQVVKGLTYQTDNFRTLHNRIVEFLIEMK